MKTAGSEGRRIGSGSRPDMGFSLVEILMAIAISMIVAGAIYSVYNTFYKQTAAQDLMLEAQQNARVGINLMERELINAGYNAGATNVITEATATSIQFSYSEPTDPSINIIMVKYNYDAVNKILTRKEDNVTLGTTGSVNTVITDVAGFTLAYYDQNGVLLAPATQLIRDTIKFVDITLTTETKSIPPGQAAKKTFMLETHLRLRSLGIGQTATDSTPPDSPTSLQVREVQNPAGTGGSCGKLKVKFTGAAAGDVTGYKIYYGTTLGTYDGIINVSLSALSGSQYSCTKSGSTITCTITPTTPVFDPTISYDTAGGVHSPATAVIYYLAVKAYDNSLNHSDYSAAAYGDASTATIAASNYAFDSGSNDSTVNPGKPAAVTGFTAADGVPEGQVNLSWSAYSTSNNPGVTKLRIYRDTSPFTYPIDPTKQVAEIATPSTTTYSDTGLEGCLKYYYAIAPVNCDTALMSNDAGDTANERFASADYGVTYGDGAGSGADSPGGSDTSPPDITPPGAPVLSKRDGQVVAGYKRTYMGVTNPADADFTHTYVYYNTTGAALTVNTTVGTPTFGDAGVAGYGEISGGNPVPDTNAGVAGKLTGSGSITFVHDNEYPAVEDITAMHAPALTGSQYHYIAVSYDRCGNPSVATADSQSLAALCGDGSPGPPLPDPEYGPPADAPTNAKVQGCYSDDYSYSVDYDGNWINANNSYTKVTWTEITTSSSHIPDAAGYRVYRSPVAPFNTGLDPSDLNTVPCSLSPGSNCYLGFFPIGTTPMLLQDANGLSDATKYSYGIVTTDCVYEERWIPNGEIAFRNNYSGWSVYNGAQGIGVTPGMVDRDEKFTVADDAHREVLLGVDIDNTSGNGTGATTPSTSFNHDTVTMFMENTANGPQMLNGVSVSKFYWVNSGARLTNVAVGGGKSGVGVINVAVPLASSVASASPAPYTMTASTTLASISLPANARNIPITLTFTDVDGNPIDMRGDQFLMSIKVINNSTNTAGKPICFAYMTVAKNYSGTAVSYGPTVNSVTQNNPASPTFVYAVPGSGGSNTVPTDGTYGTIAATGGSDTVITANINGNTLDETTGGVVGVSSATIYYIETALSVGAAPASGYTAVAMTNTSGNTWTGAIPTMVGVTGRRFWFYLVTVDADGNYDRAPEIAEGAYTYDQKPFGVCDVTPKAPTGLSYNSVAAGNASFYWPRVTQYTNNNAINTATDPLYYRVYRRNSLTGAFTKIYDVPDNASGAWVLIPGGETVSPATSSYYLCDAVRCYWWDYINANTYDITYYVQSKNSCGADLNLSAATSNWRECQNAGLPVIDVTPAAISTNGSYSVIINDCGKAGGAIDTVTANSRASIGATDFASSITEDAGNTGLFISTAILAQNVGAADTTGVYVSPTNLANDVVSVTCTGGCSSTPAADTVTVTARACDFAPSQVAGLILEKVSTGSPKGIRLTWTASADTDPPYYSIYGKLGAGTYSLLTTVAAGTTTWLHEPAKSNGQTWYYYIVATDACPLSGAASTVQGLTW